MKFGKKNWKCVVSNSVHVPHGGSNNCACLVFLNI